MVGFTFALLCSFLIYCSFRLHLLYSKFSCALPSGPCSILRFRLARCPCSILDFLFQFHVALAQFSNSLLLFSIAVGPLFILGITPRPITLNADLVHSLGWPLTNSFEELRQPLRSAPVTPGKCTLWNLLIGRTAPATCLGFLHWVTQNPKQWLQLKGTGEQGA